MTDGAWTCPTCGATVDSPFCPCCGERRLEARDLTLRGLFERIATAVTNVDRRVMRSVLALLRHPGELTVAYVTGRRKPYIGPLQVFLLANVVFFALQSVSTSNVFGASLDSHLHHQDWQVYARQLVQQRLADTTMTLASYAPKFDRVVEANAKSLVILMVVPFALLAWALFHRRDRPFLAHVTFALHTWAFLLLVYSAALVLADANLMLGGPGLESRGVDLALTAMNLLASGVYVFLAIKPVYGAIGWSRLARTIAMTATLQAIVLGYRFVLFLVTVYSTT